MALGMHEHLGTRALFDESSRSIAGNNFVRFPVTVKRRQDRGKLSLYWAPDKGAKEDGKL